MFEAVVLEAMPVEPPITPARLRNELNNPGVKRALPKADLLYGIQLTSICRIHVEGLMSPIANMFSNRTLTDLAMTRLQSHFVNINLLVGSFSKMGGQQ